MPARASHRLPTSCSNPGVLGAAALAGVDHQRAFAQRDAREAAGRQPHAVADQHEGPQIDVALGDALLDQRRAGGERQRRLGDVAIGPRLDEHAEHVDLVARGGRADQHAVAARAVHLLHHQLGQVLQHVGEVVGLAADVGRHVLQDRRAAGVELDDVRHVGVDRLVVGDAGARRVDDGEPAGAIDVEDAGHAEHRIAPEGRAGRGRRRRCADRRRRPASGPAWSSSAGRRRRRRGPGPRPAPRPSGRPGTSARSRRCCGCRA